MAVCLSSCSIADNLAGHSIEYNRQADIIKNETLLVNILRAAYRRSLQFTELSAITGQVSVSASSGFTVPFAGPIASYIANPSITVQNSPSYRVSVLNSKEFTQGILAPIPMQTVAYYILTGFPKTALLTLLVSEIEYGSPGATHRVLNLPNNEKFTKLLHALIRLGLNAEEVGETINVGAPFGQKQYPTPKEIAELDAQGIKVVRHVGREPDSPNDQSKVYYQLEKSSSSLRFCFDQNFAAHGIVLHPGIPINDTGVTLEASDLCGAGKPGTKSGGPAKRQAAGIYTFRALNAAPGTPPPHVLNFNARSNKALISYLGHLARIELRLDPEERKVPDDPIFTIREGPGDPGSIATFYEGKAYHVDIDPGGDNRSAQIMGLVLELLAQNNSAKDLPAPAVISVTH